MRGRIGGAMHGQPNKGVLFAVGAAIVVASCASVSTSDVMTLGNERYFLTANGKGGPEWDDMRKQAITKANEYCTAQGRREAVVDDMKTHGARAWTRTSVDLRFHCSVKQ